MIAIFAGMLVALLAQSTLLHALWLHDGVISAALIVLVVATRSRPWHEALLLAASCGFCEDVLCASGFAWTIATVAVIAVFKRSAEMIEMERYVALLGAIAVATMLRDLIFWSILHLDGNPAALIVHHLHMCVWNTLLTTCAAAATIMPLRAAYAPRSIYG